MTTLNAIAIDDEAPALAVIAAHAAKLPFLRLQASFTSPLQALAWLKANPVDLVFLDIEMPDLLGTELMRLAGSSSTHFIFTTAYEAYAVEGFELQALDYLLKPIPFSRFAEACGRALQRQQQATKDRAEQHLFVKDGHDWVRIDLPSIQYAKTDGNLLFIHQTTGIAVTRMTIGQFLELLPPAAFIRTHKSYVAAKGAVQRAERHQLIMNAGDKVPVARSYRSAVEQWLTETR